MNQTCALPRLARAFRSRRRETRCRRDRRSGGAPRSAGLRPMGSQAPPVAGMGELKVNRTPCTSVS